MYQFILYFIFTFISLIAYTVNDTTSQIISKTSDIQQFVRKTALFSSYIANENKTIELPIYSNQIKFNNILLIAHDNKNICLFTGIRKLYSSYNKNVANNIINLGVITLLPYEGFYIFPAREEAKGYLTAKSINRYREYLVKNNLTNTWINFNSNFYSFSKPYIDKILNKKVFSLIYPIYLDRKLTTILSIDIDSVYLTQKPNQILSTISPVFGRGIPRFNYKIKYLSIILISLISSILIYFITKIASSFLSELLYHDELTKLYTRKYINKINLKKYNSILLLDIDNFKLINDKYGHRVGDIVLKTISLSVSESLRDNDIIIRWGGEELIVLAQISSSKELYKIGERIRNKIQTLEFREKFIVTVSIGGSCCCNKYNFNNKTTLYKYIEYADQNLYTVKKGGKNATLINEININER